MFHMSAQLLEDLQISKIVKALWGRGGRAVRCVSAVAGRTVQAGWARRHTADRDQELCSLSVICVNTLLEIDFFAIAKKGARYMASFQISSCKYLRCFGPCHGRMNTK
ncbi:uncharacterized protein LOC125514387 [Triticum urartu]|uniref:uncharacterized protein LOC125514387 n=1 Tax=Triticum urartu TaxID=4572 RepID=UPI0020431161|nr:uncharacterized protein LOC125514387 [Triticum urartu]